jgi:hypothetical protein
MVKKFESFQKNYIKWILSEEELSYGADETYISANKHSPSISEVQTQ